MAQHDIGKKKALEAAIDLIEKQFGEGSVMTLGQHSLTREFSVIKTGAVALDIALGIGGVPRGRIIEFMDLSLRVNRHWQLISSPMLKKMAALQLISMAEHALDPGYAAKIGVNIDELMISQPKLR